MFKLFKTELLRHRLLAGGVAVLHLMALYYLYTLGRSVLHMPGAVLWLLISMGLSAGFGAFQMSLYRRDNDWLYLLHRPLPPRKIFLALVLAGCCMTLLMSAVPLTLIMTAMEANAAYGIEGRHYKTVVYAMAATFSAYCCGCFAMLSASRLGFLAISMTTAFAIVGVDSTLWSSALLLMLWGFLLAHSAFKPDRSQPPTRIATLLLTEIPIQYGCLWLIVLTTALAMALNNYIGGTDPARDPAPGTDYFVWSMPDRDAMLLALENSSHADADFLRQQTALGEIMVAGSIANDSYPKRQQMAKLDRDLLLLDPEHNISWRFSHDSMLFEGHAADSAQFAGWLGPKGFHSSDAKPPAVVFDSVPWVSANQYILSDDDIYQVDWDDSEVHHRYHNADGDRFNNSLTIGESTTTLFSDTSLYLFSSAELADPTVALLPKAVLALPPTNNSGLRRIRVMPLIDGYLVAAVFDVTPYDIATDFALAGHARLQLLRLRQGSAAELISCTPLASGLDEWFFYKELLLAPGMRVFTDFVWGLHERRSREITLPLLYVKFPVKIWLGTALVCLLSAGLTAWLLRRSALPLRIRIFWIVANGVTGCAGLISFFFGYYWKRQDQLLIRSAATADTQQRG